MEVGQLGITDALGVGSKGNRAIKDDSQMFDVDNRMHGGIFSWVGEGLLETEMWVRVYGE